MNSKSLEEILAEHADEWLAIPGVVGVGAGENDGRPCVVVLLSQATAEAADKLPASLAGYAVRVERIGEVRAM
jgi:hypothetical protein